MNAVLTIIVVLVAGPTMLRHETTDLRACLALAPREAASIRGDDVVSVKWACTYEVPAEQKVAGR